MFDVGFGELVIIGLVALIVVGPERLPTVARTAGLWIGKARHMLATVKADIDREMKAAELKQMLEQQAKSSGIYEIVEETRDSLQEIKEETKDSLQEVKKELQADDETAVTLPAKPTTTADSTNELADGSHRNHGG